jgi:hypothetical protein
LGGNKRWVGATFSDQSEPPGCIPLPPRRVLSCQWAATVAQWTSSMAVRGAVNFTLIERTQSVVTMPTEPLCARQLTVRLPEHDRHAGAEVQ